MTPLGNPSLLLAALTLTQCGVPSPPRCERIPRASRVAPALLISEARAAWNVFARTDSEADRERYNLVIARLADHLRCGPGSYQTRAAAMGTVFSDRDLKDARIDLSQLDSLLPASSVDVDAVGPRFLDPGLSVPMVGWISEPRNGSRRYEFAPPVGVPLNLTLWLDFDQEIPTWRLADPVPGRDGDPLRSRRSTGRRLVRRQRILLADEQPGRPRHHLDRNRQHPQRQRRKPIQTSIGTLSPMFGGFEAINSSPWRDGLERHSIIGQWWFGAGVNSSEGVVPYWSSHIEQVASELVVESFQNVTENEATIQEVARILKLNLLKHDRVED